MLYEIQVLQIYFLELPKNFEYLDIKRKMAIILTILLNVKVGQ